MIVDDLTIRYELLNEQQQWVPFTVEALGLDDDEDLERNLVGDHEMIDIWLDPLDFARDELARAASAIAWHPRLAPLAGLRAKVWPGRDAAGEPDVTVRVTHEQLAVARLSATALGVGYAVERLQKARQQLRAQILVAERDDHLGRNQIARAVEHTLSRRLVLQYLSGHDLIRDVRQMLPLDWARRDGYEHEWADELQEGPFWCGPVRMDLSPTGQVELRVVDTQSGPEFDADQDEVETYQRDARARALAAAEVVHAALDSRGIRLLKDGKDAGVQELSRFPVVLARRGRQSAQTGDLDGAATGAG
jgi:hypothetical protein